MYEKESIQTSTEVIEKVCDELKKDIVNRVSADVLLNQIESIIAWNIRIQEANNG